MGGLVVAQIQPSELCPITFDAYSDAVLNLKHALQSSVIVPGNGDGIFGKLADDLVASLFPKVDEGDQDVGLTLEPGSLCAQSV